MSSLIFILVKRFIKLKSLNLKAAKYFFYSLTILFPVLAHPGWDVDFSRRQSLTTDKSVDLQPIPDATRAPSSTEGKGLMGRVFDAVVPTQEIVILSTEQGFVPSTVRVKEGAQYRLIVVNVNEKMKNISFVLDSFSEHHATFYGQLKSFYISPKKGGVFTFISPETSAKGRLVVLPGDKADPLVTGPDLRAPASE